MNNDLDNAAAKPKPRSKFPGIFWLVVMFEFFERGSYYGMMSVLSVYFTDVLLFSKESVGTIKAVIQPILYFLPIVAGALADRFGYRRFLTVAFALLGGGYFLTAQSTSYEAVFLSLVVMALGAGTFKPIISGTIARSTDETNSTQAFGIFYWSINLGAFLFPLILVPWLKGISWKWVILASAMGTGALLIPTLLFFKEPPRPKADAAEPKKGILQTIADALEIIFSLFVLAYRGWHTTIGKVLVLAFVLPTLGFGVLDYSFPPDTALRVDRVPVQLGGERVLVKVHRNQTAKTSFELTGRSEEKGRPLPLLEVYKPTDQTAHLRAMAEALTALGVSGVRPEDVLAAQKAGDEKPTLLLRPGGAETRVLAQDAGTWIVEFAGSPRAEATVSGVSASIRAVPELVGVDSEKLASALRATEQRPAGLLLLLVLFLVAQLVQLLRDRFARDGGAVPLAAFLAVAAPSLLLVWLLPGLTYVARGVWSVGFLGVQSLFLVDSRETGRFKDHFKFLLMIAIYSGFWILYFQMFDSVLWYVKAYVDPTPINDLVNGMLASVGIGLDWRFDVEHVTVINAGTIILLQLLISSIVKNTKALPTMVVGILIATLGMACLALSTGIWVFMLGIVLFSIGEMTAHPKFISFVGQTAPRSRVATYMGYIFLYGVIGASIGSVLGANLYVHYVDNLNQPRVLWLIFSGIGVATIVGLLLYNRFLADRGPGEESDGGKESAEEPA